ncbi:protein FAM200B-like [Penaeus monodon]|uniref:protein FAM200B-like n=1 Tax=Penaeus monodon TaxID=6687 RepID=UPI0018A727C2|nr:protein FAM200B-like [Penaeus monodon]
MAGLPIVIILVMVAFLNLKRETSFTQKKVSSSTRQYSDEFLKYGFVKCEQEKGEPRPQCVICSEVLANESLKPSKLKRHLETKHPSLATKPVDYFQRRKEQMKMSVKVLNAATTLNDKAQLASYLVSYRIAKEKVPYTCGEKLILPSCVDIVSTMLDGKSADKIKCVPISDTTVSRRISDIAENLEQLVSHLQTAGEFAIQLDESTDISNSAVLLVVLNDCIVGKYKLKWANCKGIQPMKQQYDWEKSGVVTTKYQKQPVMIRLFELLCLEMGADQSHLIFHTEVRWLSRGRILTRHIEQHNNTSEETMKKLKCDIQLHLHSLSSSFEQYFPEENLKNIRDNHWVKDPFAFEKPEVCYRLNLTPDEEMNFI